MEFSPGKSQVILNYVFNYDNDFYLSLQMNNGDNLLQGGGDWTNVIIPGNAQNSGFNHKILNITGNDDICPISATLQQNTPCY